MNLAQALRLDKPSALAQTICFVGAGGKTTSLFQLARQLINKQNKRVIVTTTTHLGAWQVPLADQHIIAKNINDLDRIPLSGVILVSAGIEKERVNPVNESILYWLREYSRIQNIPLLIEADGSRQKPVKAPAIYEPPTPIFSDTVIVVAGLSSLGKPVNDEHVHRAEFFSQLSGLHIDQAITPDAIIRMLTHPQGGLKNIPPNARRIVFLNQADTPESQSVGGNMTPQLLEHFDSVIVGSLEHSTFQTFEHCAGIILAAGESTRFGKTKQLLDWKGKPFVRQVAETALQAGLWPVVVITGSHAADVESSLSGLPINIIYNPNYQLGQSTSISAGIQALHLPLPFRDTSPNSDRKTFHDNKNSSVGIGRGRAGVGSAIFLLADQPQIPVDVIRALVETHTQEMQSILAPLVLEERRANPVLFDRVTFPDLLKLEGDIGGRAIFSNYKVEYIPWHDDLLLLDVDKPEDYQRLVELEKL